MQIHKLFRNLENSSTNYKVANPNIKALIASILNICSVVTSVQRPWRITWQTVEGDMVTVDTEIITSDHIYSWNCPY